MINHHYNYLVLQYTSIINHHKPYQLVGPSKTSLATSVALWLSADLSWRVRGARS